MYRFFTVTLITLLTAACTSAPQPPVAGESLPACGSFPNCVNSENGQGSAAVAPIAATQTQWQALKDWLAKRPDWSVKTVQPNFLQAVATTPTMGYKDDVQLRYDASAQQVHVRSSSRLGIGDMGANRARVEQLRNHVSAQPR